MSEATWSFHVDGARMADAVARRVECIVHAALKARGESLVAMPGGRSALQAFECLGKLAIDWSSVTILPTDDRLVGFGHPFSNEAILVRHFLGCGARLVPLVADPATPYREAGERANHRLRKLPWPLDLVWLGMGLDGHTASLFPGPDLEAALDSNRDRYVVGVLPSPLPAEAPAARLSLTPTAIRSARHLLLMLSGSEKRDVIERAMSDENPDQSPVGRVLRNTKVDIHWSPT